MTITRLLLIFGVPFIFFVAAATIAVIGQRVLKRWRLQWGYWLLITVLAVKLGLSFLPADVGMARAYALTHAALLFAAFMLVWALIDTLAIDQLLTRYHRVKVPDLIRQILTIVVACILLTISLKTFIDFDVTPLLATSAVFTMVIGLALQDILKNLFSGLTLSMDRTYEIGDWIKVGEDEGKVIELNWRTTKLWTRENNYLVIPNATIANLQVINFSVPTPDHVLVLNIGIDYRTPPNLVKRVLKPAIAQVAGVLPHPEPQVFHVGFGDSALLFELRATINGRAQVNVIRSNILSAAWYACKRAGITIPFPMRTVELYNMGDHPSQKSGMDEKKISAVEFFREIPAEARSEIIATSSQQIYGHGELICECGSQAEAFYVILSGRVEILSPQTGKRMALLRRGEVFGEMSMMTGGARTATTRAVSDVVLLEIPNYLFRTLLGQYPSLADWLKRLLEERREKLEQEAATERVTDQLADVHTSNLLGRLRNLFKF